MSTKIIPKLVWVASSCWWLMSQTSAAATFDGSVPSFVAWYNASWNYQAGYNAYYNDPLNGSPPSDRGSSYDTTPKHIALGFADSPSSAIGSAFSIKLDGTPNNGGTLRASASGGGVYTSDPAIVDPALSTGGVSGTLAMYYTFHASGPGLPYSSTIPLHVIAHGNVASAGSGYAFASFGMSGFGVGPQQYVQTQASWGASDSFVFDQIIDIHPNYDINVVLAAVGQSIYFGPSGNDPMAYGPGGEGIAFVDPQFIIDPAFATIYHLEGVPSAVPIPGSVWLMAPSLGLMRQLKKRRKFASKLSA